MMRSGIVAAVCDAYHCCSLFIKDMSRAVEAALNAMTKGATDINGRGTFAMYARRCLDAIYLTYAWCRRSSD